MVITQTQNGILQIDNARIVFRNFSGLQTKYNREGDRNFALVIENEEITNDLLAKGWNVKIRSTIEGEAPFMYLPIKIKFNAKGPAIYLVSGNERVRLTEETVDILDNVDIENVNLDIRPYDWEVNGKQGRSAYLQAMEIIQNIDRFSNIVNYESPEE